MLPAKVEKIICKELEEIAFHGWHCVTSRGDKTEDDQKTTMERPSPSHD
jgi:hypothetical protein